MLPRILRMSYYGIQLIKDNRNRWEGLKILVEVIRETQKLNVFNLWTKFPLTHFPPFYQQKKKKLNFHKG